MKKKQNSPLYILLLVGVVSAFGPFVTDFYLPAFPALGAYFNTSASMVQLTLTVSMVGLASGQLFIGPLSDCYGRKRPLVASLVLFLFSTVGCLLATTVGQFLVFRFVQGIAGAGGVVISKSIATDLYEGKQLARFFSMLSSVQGLAPICAPVLGGVLLTVTDWRGIFWVLLFIGVALLAAVCGFRESLCWRYGSIGATFRNYLLVMRNRDFMRYVFVQAMAMGVILPASTVLALEPVRDHSGNASAILGFLTFFVGGVCSPLTGLGNMLYATALSGSVPPVRYGWQKGGSQQACEQDRRPGAATTRPSLAAWLEPDAGRWHATRLPGCLYLYNIPLEQLARAAGCSLSTFRRDFVDLFGITPSRWLMARRLEEARFLLSSGERPGDILIALGFESFSHFTRSYKLRFGVLPSHKDNRICIL